METRTTDRGNRSLRTLLAGVVILWGCADLALEADRIPTELEILPHVDRVTEGEPTQLSVMVRDQDGNALPVPGWTPPAWTVADGAAARVHEDGTLHPTAGGMVKVSARLANLTASASYCASPSEGVVTAPRIYVTQAAQGPAHKARLIAGRPALLRIFLVADAVIDFAPEVRVTLLRGGNTVFEELFVPEIRIPRRVDESTLDGSVNLEIPGSVLEPGVRMVVEIDPHCRAPLSPGSASRHPDTGSRNLKVVDPQLFRQVFVPTLWRPQPDNRLWRWLEGIGPKSEQMHLTRNLLPVSELEVEVRDTFRTNANLASGAGWGQWLNEIATLNISEGRRAYYYGVIGRSPGGILGLANLSAPWSVGVAEASTYAHEVGHNMSLLHAPCGGPSGTDPNYPYDRASIGIWGYDLEKKVLYDPNDFVDVMSYCDPVWISDYYFDLATAHRLDGDGGVVLDAASGADRGEMLVVWGSVVDGEPKLDPAFVLEGPAALPTRDGPYRVEGLGERGEVLFSLSFAPTPLEYGGGSFVYFVPYDPEWAATLDRMVLAGPEGEYTVTRYGEPEMAVLTDPSTGLIQAIIRNWDGTPIPGDESAYMTVTSGIPEGGLR